MSYNNSNINNHRRFLNAPSSSDTPDDALYSKEFEDYLLTFNRVISSDNVTIMDIAPIIQVLRTSELISLLMKDPNDNIARSCLRTYLSTKPEIPSDIYGKLLALITTTISLSPRTTSFLQQSFNVKIRVNNVIPTKRITNFSVKTLQEKLRLNLTKNSARYSRGERKIPQTVRLQFNNPLILNACINAIGDLNQAYAEGNRANGREAKDFIKINIKK